MATVPLTIAFLIAIANRFICALCTFYITMVCEENCFASETAQNTWKLCYGKIIENT